MKKITLTCLACIAAWIVTAQTLTSSNLPIIVINTNGQQIPDEPKIMADMGIVFNGTGNRNAVTDPFNHYNGKIGIEVRGESSQMFPMKSYSIELRNSSGSSIEQTMFGLPKESDWVLYAPYNDKTLLHNFLAYTMARETGRWAANCRYAELVLNGDYKGIYVFMERIKRGSGRVNIPKLNTTDITGDALTGGYIFGIDKDADAWYSSYGPLNSFQNQRIRFTYTYPKLSSIAPEQQSYLKSYVDSFENALKSVQFQDKQTGWRRFADEASFIDYLIANELSRNVDGYRLSSFFYKDRQSKGGKIIAGPVWDYDLAFRNANYCSGSDVSGWAYDFNNVCPSDFWQVPFWWDQFKRDTAFQSNLRCRWKQLRQTSLSNNRLNFLIDSVISLTAEARQRHFQRWPVLGQYVWPNPQPIPATYDGEISVLKEWLSKRTDWIEKNISNTGACFDYPASVKESVIVDAYPNPFGGQLVLQVQSRIDQTMSITLTDMMGRQMTSRTILLRGGVNPVYIPSDRFSKGIYLLHYKTASGESAVLKLMKE